MTDKVQKIRNEVEKRYECWKEKEFNSHSIESEIRMSECQHLLLMINSLQEEPVSDNFCEMADKYYKDVLIGECQMEESMAGHCRLSYYQGLKDGAQMDKKEPVSEDLEEEIRKYFLAYKGYPHIMDKTEREMKKACIHFANWQKEQTGFVRGYRKALEDAWECIGKGFPYDCRIVVKQFFDKEMGQKLKELSQG